MEHPSVSQPTVDNEGVRIIFDLPSSLPAYGIQKHHILAFFLLLILTECQPDSKPLDLTVTSIVMIVYLQYVDVCEHWLGPASEAVLHPPSAADPCLGSFLWRFQVKGSLHCSCAFSSRLGQFSCEVLLDDTSPL